ncbi:MAG: MarR family winged helix-turn-helix transcriptional regulator [Chthoniobacterales bacterium]
MSRLKPVSQQDYQTLAAFRKALREFLRFSEEAALAEGIAPQQHQTLLVIGACPPAGAVTVGEVAAHLQIKHHSAVGLVERMRSAGLITKEPDASDRRKVSLRLTAEGQRMLENLSSAHKSELARLGPALRSMLQTLEESN